MIMNKVNTEILNEVVEQAAKFQYESYGSLSTYHAFLMGMGEVEAKLFIDLDLTITKEIDRAINDRVQAFSAETGVLDHEVAEALFRGKPVMTCVNGQLQRAVIIDLLPRRKKVLVEAYCPDRKEFEIGENEWQEIV